MALTIGEACERVRQLLTQARGDPVYLSWSCQQVQHYLCRQDCSVFSYPDPPDPVRMTLCGTMDCPAPATLPPIDAACPSGTHRDPATGRCVPDTLPLPTGGIGGLGWVLLAGAAGLVLGAVLAGEH